MSKDINVTDGTVLETLNNKVDLDGGNYPGSGLEEYINTHRVGMQLFDTVLKDHVLSYEESRGLALQGTYVYKTAIAGSRYGYADFYNKCLEEYNEAASTETVNGVTVKVNSNGHKFYNIADKTAIDNFFNTMGSAWMYGVDQENERIFLPRDNFFAIKGIAPVVGNGMTLGLIGGNGYNHGLSSNDKYLYSSTGALGKQAGSTISAGSYGSGGGDKGIGVTTDPTKSGIEAHIEANEDKYLYICVGNTVSDTSWVDVVTQVESGVKDLEDKKNISIAEIEANAKSYDNLTRRQITNCLLEVPQNIKLELNTGTITLKADSKVIVPNGFETDGTTPKFDEITVEDDTTLSWTWGTPGSILIYLRTDKTLSQIGMINERVSSGATPPTQTNNQLWYDTANNIVKEYAGGALKSINNSLPVALCTKTDNVESTNINSIDQVFNGFGYIGSTVWIDKGVKGLIPNGRNEDGTLNNIEAQNNALDTITYTTDIKGVHFGFDIYGNPGLNGLYRYDEKDNYVYNGENKGPTMFCGTYDVVGGKVANFQPKTTFHAVDYNELKSYIVETYVNGKSWYRVYSDGWIEQGGYVSSIATGGTITFLKPFKDTNYIPLVVKQSTSNTGQNGTRPVVSCNASSKTSMTVYNIWTSNDSTFSISVYWEAKGY